MTDLEHINNRLSEIRDDVRAMRESYVSLDTFERETRHIRETVRETSDRADKTYALDAEFRPIQRLVYAIITAVLVALVGAGMALI